MTKTLYKLSKNNSIEIWKIEVINNVITTTWGKLNGNLQTKTEIIAKGKNIGKVNETTPAEQAEFEAESTYKSKLDRGYAPSIELATLKKQEIKPVLVEDYTEPLNKKKIIWSEGVLVQPKLDGIRCNIFLVDGEIQTKSRGNKSFPVNTHLFNQIKNYMIEFSFTAIDGEFYQHGQYLEDISSVVKNPVNNPLEDTIEFHIFDLPNDRFPMEHYNRLNTATTRYRVKVVEGQIVYSELEAREVMNEYLEAGYEGVILRNKCTFDADYPSGGIRSSNIQKWKDVQDSEYIIVDIVSDKNENAVYVCRTAKDQIFNVTPKCNFETKKKILANKSEYIGKLLTVKFQDLTPDGIPRFGRGITVRDYE